MDIDYRIDDVLTVRPNMLKSFTSMQCGDYGEWIGEYVICNQVELGLYYINRPHHVSWNRTFTAEEINLYFSCKRIDRNNKLQGLI